MSQKQLSNQIAIIRCQFVFTHIEINDKPKLYIKLIKN